MQYILQAAAGLQYVHDMGVIHRDVKPANLLIDRHGTLNVLDVGIARWDLEADEQNPLTFTGEIMGTPDFMAPEQSTNAKAADIRADVYSLGITLWYLLSGKTPYGRLSVIETILAHREQPIPSLCSVCPEASPALDRLFQAMVAKSPNSRCRSMAEVSTKISNCMRPRLPWRIVHALGGSRKNAKLPNRVTRKDQTIGMSSSSIPRRFFNTVSSPEALPKPRTGFKPTCGYVTPVSLMLSRGFETGSTEFRNIQYG